MTTPFLENLLRDFFGAKSHQLPLSDMTIAVWSPSLFKEDYSSSRRFIVETLLSFTDQHPDKKFFILTDISSANFISKNTEILIVKPSKNVFLKKIWWDVKLPRILKKIKTDLFISMENRCSLTTSISQAILIPHKDKTKHAFIKKATLIFVLNESMKNQINEKYKVEDEKIGIIKPFGNKLFKPANDKEKELSKAEYSDGKEFFLYNSNFSRREDFIELLKSFSHFKKRQQSNFKLLLLTKSNSFFEKSLSAYKYRSDVKFVGTRNDAASITAAAYSVILPFDTNEDMITAFNSMQAGVPVITTKNSVISEVAGDAILCADNGIKDIADKMMQLYKDENYRFALIEKGRSLASIFTPEKTAQLLWQSIMKGLG